ncbi:hypothetical protein WJX81_002983 [Elliptochloris bilobata]|uniref:HTH HARE-type domain-containing protein n=1 Tax=Elliptochloris bilobata TaxID=381761 RepID=A0AAW1SHS8_9CHLO
MFEVLNTAGDRGLTIEEMLKQMRSNSLKAPGGLTPVNTIQGLISQHNDIFVRTDAGKYALQGHLPESDGVRTALLRAVPEAAAIDADGNLNPGGIAARPTGPGRGGGLRRGGPGRGAGKRRKSEQFGAPAKRLKHKRRLAGEDSDDGEWRVPAAHAQLPVRAASGGVMQLFVPAPPPRAGPSPTPPPPRPAASGPLPAAAAAEAAAREARIFADFEDGEGDEEDDGEGFGAGFASRLTARQAAAAAAIACESSAPPGFEPCVRTTDAKPDGWTEYTADCPMHGEKRFDRLTKVAVFLREHCRCRRDWGRLGPQAGEGDAEHLARLRPLFSFSRRASLPDDAAEWLPGPLGVLADVAADFEREAEWDAAPAQALPRGCADSACAQRACYSGYVATESDSDGSETADDAAADVKRARDGAAPRVRGLLARRASGSGVGVGAIPADIEMAAADSPARQHRAVLAAARVCLDGDGRAWADFAAWLVGQPAPSLRRVFDTFCACVRNHQEIKEVVLAMLKRHPPPLPAVARGPGAHRMISRAPAHSA